MSTVITWLLRHCSCDAGCLFYLSPLAEVTKVVYPFCPPLTEVTKVVNPIGPPQAQVTKHEWLAWLGFMHVLATNVCLWFRTLVNEIMNDYIELATAANSTVAPSTIGYSNVSAALPLDGGDVISAASLAGYTGFSNTTAAVTLAGYGDVISVTTTALHLITNVRNRRGNGEIIYN